MYEQFPDQSQFTASRLYAERTFSNCTGERAEYSANSNFKKSQAKYQSKTPKKHIDTKHVSKKNVQKPQNKNLQKVKHQRGKH